MEGVKEEVSETAALCARVRCCGKLTAFLLFFDCGRGGTEVEKDGGEPAVGSEARGDEAGVVDENEDVRRRKQRLSSNELSNSFSCNRIN